MDIVEWSELYEDNYSDLTPFEKLTFHNKYKLYKYDVKYINNLESDKIYEITRWYLNRKMLPDMLDYQENKNFEMARYIAQRYINLSNTFPYYENFSYGLSQAHFIIENQYNNFPYNDLNIQDILSYKKLAENEKTKMVEWLSFIKIYPKSLRVDDAYANIIYAMINKHKRTPLENSRVISTLNTALKQTNPKSYLYDDFLFYAIHFNFENSLKTDTREYIDAERYLQKLLTEYRQSDHYKRLISEISDYYAEIYYINSKELNVIFNFIFNNYFFSKEKVYTDIDNSDLSKSQSRKLKYHTRILLNNGVHNNMKSAINNLVHAYTIGTH